MKGFINVIKPVDMSSAKAVSIVKKKLHLPCGHMGTLDPMASGVLPVGIDKTCRLFPYLLDKVKRYEAVFKFGILTDTLDSTGTVTNTTDYIPSTKEIRDNLSKFIGKIEQIPPKYSAKCVNGKRGYELARQNVEFELEAKKVTVLSFELVEKISNTEYKFAIECTGGTYIRSLARDLGYSVNSLAIMTALDRTHAGIFNYSNGVTVDEILSCESITDYVIRPELSVSYDSIILTEQQATKILNGIFDVYPYADGLYKVYNQSEFWGIGEVKEGVLKIKSYVR